MNKNTWTYTGVLLVSLMVVLILASRGTVQSVINEGDINLSADAMEYQGDEVIRFHIVLNFADLEHAAFEEISLSFIDGSPLDLKVSLPLPISEGEITLDEDNGTDQLNPMTADVRFVDIAELDGVPSQTFKGISQNARIEIDVDWNPDQSAQQITGDYTAELAARLSGSAEEKRSNSIEFSIVPVTIEVIAPQNVAPNSEFEALCRRNT